METASIFKLRLAEGIQTFRLDEDSVDYDWKGAERNFHGTLPYENLRLKSRIKRRDKVAGQAAVFLALLFMALPLLLPYSWLRHVIVPGGVVVINLVVYLTLRHIRGGTICFQIEPRVFGFAGEMPVPDTRVGRAFLLELEAAWNESLRRRFLGGPISREAQLQRINWLQFIGVLTSEEAAAERALFETEVQAEQRLIALN